MKTRPLLLCIRKVLATNKKRENSQRMHT